MGFEKQQQTTADFAEDSYRNCAMTNNSPRLPEIFSVAKRRKAAADNVDVRQTTSAAADEVVTYFRNFHFQSVF